jgi:hypothetical protein
LIDAPVFIKLGHSLVLHRDNFMHFKVTCKGPHSLVSPTNIVITLLGKADLLIIETLKPKSKKSLTLHSTNF